MANIVFTDRSNIRLGFEIECYIKDRHIDEWEKAVTLFHRSNNIDDDGSIETPDWEDGTLFQTYEIQTAVLPPLSALNNLKALFDAVAKWGGTNETCGLHLNISSTSKRRMKAFNPFPFVASPIWNRMVKDFNREDNDYCVPPDLEGGPMEIFESLGGGDGWGTNGCSFFDKDSCVNFANWDGGDGETSRVEIRGMGGNKYHYRFPLVSTYTGKVMKLFMLCCDIPLIDTRFKV